MARNSNIMKSEIIRISTTSGVKTYLEELVKTGLYGKSLPEAAERLLSISIQKLITEGAVPRRNPVE